MFVFAAVLSVLLAVVGLAAGLPKALLKGSIPAQLQSPGGFSAPLVRFIGLAELAAAAGLIAGTFFPAHRRCRRPGIRSPARRSRRLPRQVRRLRQPGELGGNAMAPIILTVIAIAAAATPSSPPDQRLNPGATAHLPPGKPGRAIAIRPRHADRHRSSAFPTTAAPEEHPMTTLLHLDLAVFRPRLPPCAVTAAFRRTWQEHHPEARSSTVTSPRTPYRTSPPTPTPPAVPTRPRTPPPRPPPSPTG